MRLLFDTIPDNTYFENILLGLPNALHEKCVGIKNTYLKKIGPIAFAEITAWEHKHGVLLPEDLRRFYLASNGYTFEYTYTFSGDDSVDDMVTGRVHVNSLEDLAALYGYETTPDTGVKYDGQRYVIRLGTDSKIFELSLLPERGKVVLVYLYPKYVPTIWLMTTTTNLYFLADDIATYLRMSITHLGIPNWQLAYTPIGLPQWSENMFRMLAPHLLPLNRKLERHYSHNRTSDEDFPEIPVNKLDPSIFKQLPRTTHLSQPSLQETQSSAQDVEFKQLKNKENSSKDVMEHTKSKTHKFQRKPLYQTKKR